MKIIRQSSDELILRESRIKEIIFTVFCVLLLLVSFLFVIKINPNTNIFSSYQTIVSILIPILALLVPIGMLLFSSYIRVDLNKTTGQLIYQKRFLVGAKTQQYNILDVVRIETRRRWKYQYRNQRLMTQSVLIFKDDMELPLDHEIGSSLLRTSSGALMGAPGQETTTASVVASFLGVPFQEVAPPGTFTTEPPIPTPKGVKIALYILLVIIFGGIAVFAYFSIFKG